MSVGRLFVISGPSGSGKTTLYKKLLQSRASRNRLVKVVSYTTRLPRRGERQGQDYLFVTKAEFLKRKNRGGFLESQNVFGSWYGTPKKEALDYLRAGRDVLLCIDVKGAKAIKKIFPKAVLIFILPPSISALTKRLRGRSTEKHRDIRRRLQIARDEIAAAKWYDHRLINDNLSAAASRLKQIIKQEGRCPINL